MYMFIHSKHISATKKNVIYSTNQPKGCAIREHTIHKHCAHKRQLLQPCVLLPHHTAPAYTFCTQEMSIKQKQK